MKILITGGAGFLGKRLAKHLLQSGVFQLDGKEPHNIEKITLFDASPRENLPEDSRIEFDAGDISDHAAVERAAEGADLCWHLAAVLSGGAEAEFDLGMRVNVSGMLVLLEILRAAHSRPRLVSTSSVAVYGSNTARLVTDQTPLTPQSSYGTQKAIGELLVADYSRKGFIDGRSVRLPTITVRPGKPNRAASGFASSIVREPLSGVATVCPVRKESQMYVASPRMAVESLVRAMQLSDASLGTERSILLPGITVSVAEMVDALERVAGHEAAGRISWEMDPMVQRLVDSWPTHVRAERAMALGFQADPDFDSIIRAHIEDELMPARLEQNRS